MGFNLLVQMFMMWFLLQLSGRSVQFREDFKLLFLFGSVQGKIAFIILISSC